MYFFKRHIAFHLLRHLRYRRVFGTKIFFKFILTCDQASLASLTFFVAAGRYAWYNYLTICLLLVQNLDFSLIGQETKRYLELSHDWLPLWRCDFREKKNPACWWIPSWRHEASEESEFLSALNASLQSFVHKTLNDEQIECIHRIACHGRDVLAVLPTGLGKSAI